MIYTVSIIAGIIVFFGMTITEDLRTIRRWCEWDHERREPEPEPDPEGGSDGDN